MPILVNINIQIDFLLTSDNYFYCSIRRLWGVLKPALKFLNLLGAHWSKCPHLPKGQSKLGLKPCRKKRGFSIYHHLVEQREESWQVKPTKGTAAGSVGRGFFLHIIRVCHLLSSLSGHIYPIGSPFNHSFYSLEC